MSERIGDWIATYTGRRFYPFDPRTAEIDIADIAHALALVNRFTGHTTAPYSVAEHSVRVMLEVERQMRFGRHVAPALPLAALLHDASEAYLCDVAKPVKRAMPEYRAAEARVQEVIFHRFGIDPDLGRHPLIHDADEVLLFTEKRDLMPRSPEWGWSRTPLVEPISPFPWGLAEKAFLDHFRRCVKMAHAPLE